MGKVKEVLVELDGHRDAVVTMHGIAIGDLHLTVNDLEQTILLIHYLRETRPFETLAEITHTTFPQLESLDIATPRHVAQDSEPTVQTRRK